MAREKETEDLVAIEQLKLDQEAKRLALMERQMALQEQQAATMATQVERTAPKENPNYQAQSIFLQGNGEPWAKTLKCDLYLNSIHLNDTPLTKPEVDALNRLEACEETDVVKIDRSIARVAIRPKRTATGRIERLTIETPLKKDDNPQYFPAIVDDGRGWAEQLAPKAVA